MFFLRSQEHVFVVIEVKVISKSKCMVMKWSWSYELVEATNKVRKCNPCFLTHSQTTLAKLSGFELWQKWEYNSVRARFMNQIDEPNLIFQIPDIRKALSLSTKDNTCILCFKIMLHYYHWRLQKKPGKNINNADCIFFFLSADAFKQKKRMMEQN